MGPPSRYAVLAAAAVQTSNASDDKPVAARGIDTSSFSNAEWAKHHLTQLATSSSPEEFKARASTFLAKHVNITMNGAHLSREQYLQQWGAAAFLGGSISVTGVVEANDLRIPMIQNAALIGILYEATFSNAEASDVRGSEAPIRLTISSSINITIGDDKTLPLTETDRRRAVSINQVLIDKNNVLSFPIRD